MSITAEIVRKAINPAAPPTSPAAARLFDGLTQRERQEYFGRWAYDGKANQLIGRDDYLGKIVLWDGKTLKRRNGDGYTTLRSVN